MLDTYYLQRFTLIVGLSFFSYLPLAQAATNCSTVRQIPQSECRALVNLYTSTNGAKWKNNSGWNKTNTPCSWKGITCDSGNVSRLALHENRLNGSIPKSLGKLSRLKKLYLYKNQLGGSIPKSLGKLSNLEMLSLSRNQLSGSIPESLGDLSNLKKLYLYKNQLSGSIPESLGNLSNLKILYLYKNQLSGSIPESLGKLSNLEMLSLSRNQLSGSIPKSLSKLSKLKKLYLYKNKLCGGTLNWSVDLEIRTDPLASCPKITDCSTVTQIPQSECDALVDLYTSTNGAKWKDNTNWNKTNAPCSWKGVTCDSGHVTFMALDNNQLSGSIPESLGKLSKLKGLSLKINQLSGSIPESLGKLSKLMFLYLNINQLSGSIPESLGKLSKLKDLYLFENQLSGFIPESLGKLRELSELNLARNRLNGSIPKSLGNLINLKFLYLSENRLSGFIPESLGKLRELVGLDLGNNELSGSIPSLDDKLSKLEFLYLNGNQLSGSIPESLGKLRKLKHLNLPNNRLSSTIPKSLGDLRDLEYIRLNGNQLSGSIPESLGKLSKLKLFSLGDNQLSGSIPNSLGDLNDLFMLFLDNNYLSGSIPKSLGKLSKLEKLYLQDNRLSGSIPDKLGYLKNLQYLYLNNNRLCGDLPASLMKLDIKVQVREKPHATEISLEENLENYLRISKNYLTTSNKELSAWLEKREPYWTETQGMFCPKVKKTDCTAQTQVNENGQQIACQSHYCRNRDKYLDILDTTSHGSIGLMCLELANWQKKVAVSLRHEIKNEFQKAVGGWLAQTKEEVKKKADLITNWSELQKFHSLNDVCVDPSKWQGWIDSIGSPELKSKVRDGLRNTVTKSLYKWKLNVEEELHKCTKYSALVIGINDYDTDLTDDFKSLTKPAADARDIALVLRYDYGFEVTTLLDEKATQSDIQKAYQRLLYNADENEYVLIFYTGHGIKKDGISYWLPTDTTANDEKTMISLDDVTTFMCESNAEKIFIVSDSCYFKVSSNKKSCPSIGSGKKKSRVALSSGNLEPVLDGDPDNRGGPSPFANAFLKGLSEPLVEKHFTHYKTFHTDNLFYEYFNGTKFSRKYGQHPQYYGIPEAGHEEGNFVFQSMFLNEHHKHQFEADVVK